jgi:hypothetical protein
LKSRRRIEISVEREEIAVHRRGRPIARYCEDCGAQVVMLPMEAAAILTGASVRVLYRWLEEGKFHFFEAPDGTTFVCAESVKALG